MVVGPDGTIYLGGTSNAYYALRQPIPVGSNGEILYFDIDQAFAVAAYNPDGSVRTAFGDHGVAVADMLSRHDRGDDERVRSLAVQGDGKVIAAGIVFKEQPEGSDSHNWDQSDIGVVRFNADGGVDPAFGKRVEDFPRFAPGVPRSEYANSVAAQPDGKVLVAGYTSARDCAGGGWALVRYNPDGTRDATFGDDGRLIAAGFAAPDPSDPENNRGDSQPRELLVQPDGKVVAFGNLDLSYIAMLRFTPGGALDASFGDGGRVTARGIEDFDYTVGLRDDGSITVAGVGSGSDWIWIDQSRNTMTSVETGHEVYTGTFDSAGRRVSSARAVHIPIVANEDLWGSATTPDGKIIGIGQMHPAVAHDNPAYPYTADALLVQFDLSQLTVDGPDSRDAGGGAAAPVFSGRASVRAGKWNTFRLIFGSEEAARQAQVFVAGPDGSSTAARLVKVKSLRGGGGRSRPAIRLTVGATSPAVATYRVAAPGGRYDAADNGTYAVRVASAGDAAGATTVGQFSVASRVGGGATAARRATEVLRDDREQQSA